MPRASSLEKTLMLAKTEGKRRRGQKRVKWLDGITDSMDMNLSKLQKIVKNREAWILQWVALLQGIFPTQGLNPGLLHGR